MGRAVIEHGSPGKRNGSLRENPAAGKRDAYHGDYARKLRVASLKEQDHKRWEKRRDLIVEQLAAIDPDLFAMNEGCIPLQTARWIQKTMRERYGRDYALVQQTRVNGLSAVEGEALLTRLPIVETGKLDYRTRDIVALGPRRAVNAPWTFTSRNPYMSRGDESRHSRHSNCSHGSRPAARRRSDSLL